MTLEILYTVVAITDKCELMVYALKIWFFLKEI